ncbi:MAG: molecular chaperone TorD family protein [Actinomycetia bacterium]|nr:molecular chaperone TorD family protein [Actinomycetes bacterium]
MTEWVDESRTRQGLYRFIGAAFRTPEPEHLDVLGAAIEFLDGRDLDRYAYSRQWRGLVSAWPTEGANSELAVEHVRLFASGMKGTPAPPIESHYRVSAKGGGVAEFVAELQREYRSMGLVSVGLAEAPDHVSTEFEIMSYLCGIEADAWESDQEGLAWETLGLAGRFLDRHLSLWIPPFARSISNAQPLDLYLNLGRLAHAFVIHDADSIRMLRREVESP